MKEIIQIIRMRMTGLYDASVIDRIYKLFKYKFSPDEQPDELKLPKWVNKNKERFNEILSIITWATNDGLKTNVDGREVTLHNAESLLKGIARGKINRNEFKRENNDIVDDVEPILQNSMLARSQENMVKLLSLLTEISKSKYKKTDK